MEPADTDTICAIATSPGRGGVGIVRISGPRSLEMAERLLHFKPEPRHAHYCRFMGSSSSVLDQGIALFFPGPHSFTGEDVLELQGHGGIHVLNTLIKELAAAGIRIARPGEFSERAFLNNKIDLTQAEAIADLIDSSSEQAARSAMRTLQGEFSRLVQSLSQQIIELRVYVEASIDFSDEEIDFLSEGGVADRLQAILTSLTAVIEQARQGTILKEGMSVVIAGKPNAGKSSLLNALAGKETAIVTDVAGTTRDVLREHINIDGMPLHIIDTAGLRDSADRVEQEGIRRAREAITQADRILLVIDAAEDHWLADHLPGYLEQLGLNVSLTAPITVIRNKIDLVNESPSVDRTPGQPPIISLCAREANGLPLLTEHLKDCMGFSAGNEDGFIARSRHLDALRRAQKALEQAAWQLEHQKAGELVAEDLRLAHQHLGEITGQFTTDDLLGKIFASFCIGK